MNFEEFEPQARDAIEQALNQLHAATLLANQLEMQVSEAGRTIQSLSHLIEVLAAQHRNGADKS